MEYRPEKTQYLDTFHAVIATFNNLSSVIHMVSWYYNISNYVSLLGRKKHKCSRLWFFCLIGYDMIFTVNLNILIHY